MPICLGIDDVTAGHMHKVCFDSGLGWDLPLYEMKYAKDIMMTFLSG